MDRTVTQIVFPISKHPMAKRVAAYARVSSGKDAMLHSLSAQISYYNELIQNHRGWQFAGIYADEAKTGTKDSREYFNKLVADCKAGKIDMVITKSISRFARNTVTLLKTVRELKSVGVDVYFEEQNIHSMSNDGELMLTILASYAQEESRSASENQKWRIKKLFEQGLLPMCFDRIYGYRRTANFGFEVVPEEAEIIREIFSLYLSGDGFSNISKKLNDRGVLNEDGTPWKTKKVRYLLSNERYIGDLLLQKNYVADHLTKKKMRNDGQKTKYYVKNNHEPIISKEMFSAVQEELKKRSEKYYKERKQDEYPFTGILICAGCGKHYQRKVTAHNVVWICSTFNKEGKSACASKQIPEKTLIKETVNALGISDFDEMLFKEKITTIIVENNNRLIFTFKDGSEYVRKWKDRSRSESWTPEMKEKARQHAYKRRRNA